MTTDTHDAAENALTFLRHEKARLKQITDAVEALRLASGRIAKAHELAKQAGEILISAEVAQAQNLIGAMVGKLFDARNHKTHEELDAMMKEATESARHSRNE